MSHSIKSMLINLSLSKSLRMDQLTSNQSLLFKIAFVTNNNGRLYTCSKAASITARQSRLDLNKSAGAW